MPSPRAAADEIMPLRVIPPAHPALRCSEKPMSAHGIRVARFSGDTAEPASSPTSCCLPLSTAKTISVRRATGKTPYTFVVTTFR